MAGLTKALSGLQEKLQVHQDDNGAGAGATADTPGAESGTQRFKLQRLSGVGAVSQSSASLDISTISAAPAEIEASGAPGESTTSTRHATSMKQVRVPEPSGAGSQSDPGGSLRQAKREGRIQHVTASVASDRAHSPTTAHGRGDRNEKSKYQTI